MKRRGEFPGIPTTDLLMGLLVAMIFFVTLSLVQQTLSSGKAAHTKANAFYLIKLEWPGESDSDVDVYLGDSLGHLVYFRRLQDGLMCLTRDDTGHHSNKITLPDGREVVSAVNQEVVEIRGLVVGEYCCNVHLYRQDGTEPIKCVVTLYQVTESQDVKLHEKVVTLSRKGEEITAMRFSLMADGTVADINELQKHFTGVEVAAGSAGYQ
jgi:hypothetical protein